MNCTVAIAADDEQELIAAAVQHAVAVHGHSDTPELRNQVRSLIKQGTPPLQAPRRKKQRPEVTRGVRRRRLR
jgi:predicted small metal-binding protein